MRLSGWEARLEQVLDAARKTPYALGRHDCFRVACQVVHALTGVDRWAEFAGTYATKREALREIARRGGTFEDAGDWFFGAARIDCVYAKRGDVVAVQTTDGDKHLGVCLGVRSAMLGPHGLVFLPTTDCLCAWSIG